MSVIYCHQCDRIWDMDVNESCPTGSCQDAFIRASNEEIKQHRMEEFSVGLE